MNGRLVQNEETGEHGIWDGQTLTPLHGRIVTNEKGDKALWDGKKLTPVKMDFDMSLPGAKEDVGRVESVGQTPTQPQPQPAAPPQEQPKSFGQRALQFGKEAALPAAGSLVGARYGGIPGAVIGGMAGEAATQALGVKPSSVGDVIATGAMEAAIPGAGRLYQPAKGFIKKQAAKLATKLPGASAALKQPLITHIKSVAGRYAPDIPSEQLYKELAEEGDFIVQTPSFRKTVAEVGAEQPGLLPSTRSPRAARDAAAIAKGQVYPETGVSFTTAQRQLKKLNEQIGVARSRGGEELHALTRKRQALIDDLDVVGEAFPKLKQANQAFKQESARDELKAMIEGGVKTIESAPAARGKRSVVDFDAKGVIDKLRKSTNPRNPEGYDKLLVDGLGGKKNVDEVMEALEKINDYGPVKIGWSGGGSLVAQSGVAGAGTALAGLAMGGPGGALVGGLLGAAAPSIMAEALLKRPARTFLLKSLKSSGGKITNPDQFFATLAALTQRVPTLSEGE